MKVALIGITGYGGMVLYQMLKTHPGIDQVDLYARHLSGPTPLNQLVPNLFDGQPVYPYDSQKILANDGAVFFATPAGVTKTAARPYLTAHFPVIDLSGDYRLKNGATYEKWYHQSPAATADLKVAHYGLTDFCDATDENLIANPGCYATATLLGLAPLIIDQLIDLDTIVVDAKSGTSGAGKKPTSSTHFTQVNENAQLYNVNHHKHIPEIVQQLQAWDPAVDAIQFSTTLLPITRGILATIYAKPKPGVNKDQVVAAFKQTYATDPFVRYTGENLPTIKQVVGTNYCDLGVLFNERANTIMVASVIDNLIKGAGGQAIQNFNQRFNFAPTAGLPTAPLMP